MLDLDELPDVDVERDGDGEQQPEEPAHADVAVQRRCRSGDGHPIGIAPATTCITYRLTDNWLELTVRFVVPEIGIREQKDAMSREVLDRLEQAGIGIASTTFEIVGLPPVRIQDGRPGARHAPASRERGPA